MPYRTTREHFERLAEEAVATLPQEFRRLMRNVSIAVEDYPSKEDARMVGVPRQELLGLFAGGAHGEGEGFFDLPSLPRSIVLFQRNIEAVCASEGELLEEIRATLLHEVGHYFGLSEEDLERYE